MGGGAGGRGAELEVRAWQARAVSLLVTWAEAAGSAGLAHGAAGRAAELAEGASDRCLADDCLGYGLLSALGAAPGGSDAQLVQLQGLQRAQQCFFSAFAAAAVEMAEEWGAPPPLEKPTTGPSGALASASPAPAPSVLEGGLGQVGGGGIEELETRLEAAESGLLEALQRAEEAETAASVARREGEAQAREAGLRLERVEREVREARGRCEEAEQKLEVATQQVDKLGLLVQELNEELNASRRVGGGRGGGAASSDATSRPAPGGVPASGAARPLRPDPSIMPSQGSDLGREEPPNPFLEGDTTPPEKASGGVHNPFEDDDGAGEGDGGDLGAQYSNPFEEGPGGGDGSNPFEA